MLDPPVIAVAVDAFVLGGGRAVNNFLQIEHVGSGGGRRGEERSVERPLPLIQAYDFHDNLRALEGFRWIPPDKFRA